MRKLNAQKSWGVTLACAGALLLMFVGPIPRLVGVAASAATGPITIKVGFSPGPGEPLAVAGDRFASDVGKFSNGAMTVNVYPGGQLGGEAEMVQAVSDGNLTMAIVNTGTMVRYEKNLGMLQLPFLANTPEGLLKAANSKVVQQLIAGLPSKSGLRVLAFLEGTPRDLVMRDKPIRTVADLKGMKIRALQSPITVAFVQAIGAVPVALPVTQVYQALQTGLIDGSDSTPTDAAGLSYAEVAKYCIKLHWTATPYSVVIGEKTWQGLTPSQQEIIKRAITDVTSYEATLQRTALANAYGQLQAKGMTLITPDINGFRAAAEQAYSLTWNTEFGKTAIETMRSAAR